MKDIIKRNVKMKKEDKNVKLIIYYKNKKSSNLVIQNNTNTKKDVLRQTNIIYEYQCPMPHGQMAKYIGMTQSTLSQRLTSHKQQGSILEHHRKFHKETVSRDILIKNTKIID